MAGSPPGAGLQPRAPVIEGTARVETGPASASQPPARPTLIPAERVAALLRRRWIVWGALAFTMLAVILDRVSLGVVADRLMADFAIGGAAVGSLAASYYYIYAVLQLPAGIVTDRFGPRWVAASGIALAALGSFLFAAAPNLVFLYLGRFLVGIGVSVVFTSVAKVQAEWFRSREYATITGLVVAVSTVGAVLGTAPLALLVSYTDWRVAYALIGTLSLLAAIAVWRLVTDRPAAAGLPSPRDLEAQERGEAPSPPQPARPAIDLRAGVAQVVGSRGIWPPFIAMLGVYGPYVAMTGVFGIPYLMQVYELPRGQAALFPALAAIGMMVGGPLAGLLSDRLLRSRRQPYLLMTAGGALIWIALAFWNGGRPPILFLYVFFFLLGLTNAMFIIGLTIAKELNPPTLAGIATGFMNISSFAGAALFQPLAGWILDQGWTGALLDGARAYPLAAFQGTFYAAIAVCLIATAGAWLTPETYRGSRQ